MKGAIVLFFFLVGASVCFADPTEDLFDALEKSDHLAFKEAMNKKPNVKAKNDFGETVLHVCARVGDARPIPILVEAGVRVDATNRLGQTALHVAAAYDHGEEVRVLVALNARIRVEDRNGMTPMDLALQNEEEDSLIFLLQEAEREDAQIPVRKTPPGGGILSAVTAVPVALAAGFFLTVLLSSKSVE